MIRINRKNPTGVKMMTDYTIKLYGLSTCSHCKATRRLLDECQVDYFYEEVDRLEGKERSAAIEAVKQLNPRCSFPTLVINDKVIVGFKENDIMEALEK